MANVFDKIVGAEHVVAESSLLKATGAGHILSMKCHKDLDNGSIVTRGAWVEAQVFDSADYAAGKKSLEDEDAAIRTIAEGARDSINTFLNSEEIDETVNKPINEEFVKRMSNGIKILGQVTKKCYVKKEGNNTFRIILTQGLNRQIRRMCEALGYEVIKLKRIRIMNINLGELRIGEWRDLTYKELKGLNNLISTSGKTKEVDEK